MLSLAQRLGRPLIAQASKELQQKRCLNIHEYQVRNTVSHDVDKCVSVLLRRRARTFCRRMQGAQLMSKFGINVPDGAAAQSIPDVVKAADSMKDSKGEVRESAQLARYTRTCPTPGSRMVTCALQVHP